MAFRICLLSEEKRNLQLAADPGCIAGDEAGSTIEIQRVQQAIFEQNLEQDASNAVTEGFNNKARVTTKRACGYRTYRGLGVAHFHTLGSSPTPEVTHRFC